MRQQAEVAALHERPARRLFTRADELLRTPSPLSWAIRGMFTDGSFGGLVGPSGSFKTFVALDMMATLASGLEWFGRPTKPGAGFYLCGEGRRGIAKRLRGWELERDASLDGAPLFVSDRLPPLAIDRLAGPLIIDEINRMSDECASSPRVVCIDTVARALAGADENSAADVGEFVRACDSIRDRFGCGVLAVHHTGHNGEKRARGSSAFYAAIDYELQVEAKKNESTITLTCSKAKDWERSEPITLFPKIRDLDWPAEGGGWETSIVLEVPEPGSGDAVKHRQARELRAQGMSLREIASQLGVGKSTVERWLS